MSTYTAIDLSQLAPPPVVEPLDYETIFAELKADLIARDPDLAPALALESEPLTKLLQVVAYRELILRGRINDAARAVLLATATGADLDHLAAFFGVARLTLDPGDPDATPPIPPTLETDARLRTRTQLALEGYSTAGPSGAYIFHALSASADARDVAVASPTPGDVLVTILSQIGDGTADAGLLAAVDAALSAETVRPLTDRVTVQSADISTYTVEAALTTYTGPDPTAVLAAAEAAAANYAAEHHRIGHDITRSGLFAALHQPGVHNVTLTSPAADIIIGPEAAAYCTGVSLAHAGEDV